ncbi:MAG: ABC transporter permease [Eubacteriales bacterium]|nr:ABC transporter permease [Eubacteriales bacterium]
MNNIDQLKRGQGRLKKAISNYLGIVLVLIVIMAVSTAINPVFIKTSNLINILVNSCTIALAGFGMTFVILTGGIDLSVGALAAFIGVFAADLLQNNLPIFAVVILGLLLGAAIGAGIGWIVAKTNIPAFIVTLGMMDIFRGLSIAYNDGYPVPISLDNVFTEIGNGKLGTVPIPIIIVIVVFIVCYTLLKKTNIGRNVFAIGGNAEAAKLSGISVIKTTMFAYGICSALTAVAGMILAARLYSGLPSAAEGLELQAIAAVVLGGTSFTGGDGDIVGTVIGVLLLQVLLNVMVIFSFPAFLQYVVQGSIIILAVLYDFIRKKRF